LRLLAGQSVEIVGTVVRRKWGLAIYADWMTSEDEWLAITTPGTPDEVILSAMIGKKVSCRGTLARFTRFSEIEIRQLAKATGITTTAASDGRSLLEGLPENEFAEYPSRTITAYRLDSVWIKVDGGDG
jgi:hypothetical protein